MEPHHQLPRWIIALLKKVIDPYYFDSIYGDLLEDFERRSKFSSAFKAKATFIISALGFIISARHFQREKTTIDTSPNQVDMLANFIRISIRSFLKRKFYFSLNVIGLSLGFVSFIAIQQYVSFEKSYDRHHAQVDHLYRIYRIDKANSLTMANSNADLAPLLADGYAGIKTATRFWTRTNAPLKYGRNADIIHLNMLYADDQFFSVFSFQSVAGPSEGLLQKPNTAVISKTTATRLFGDGNAVGQVIGVKDPNFPLIDYTVTNVIEDVPANTHFTFDVLLSLSTPVRDGRTLDEMGWGGFYTYVMTHENVASPTLQEKLADLGKRYFVDNDEMTLAAQPVSEIHLQSAMNFELGENNDQTTVNYLSMIAFFILLMAYINYINFATAKSFDRAKEVGMRKILGAQNRSIQMQMFVETLLLNVLCFALAFTLFLAFAHYLPIDVFDQRAFNPAYFRLQDFTLIGGFIVAGAFISSYYPALVLSSYNLVDILKHKFGAAGRKLFSVRNALTVVQFTISIALIITTTVVVYQINFMLAQDKGIELTNVVIIKPPSIPGENHRQGLALFKQKLSQHADVLSVSTASTTPGRGYNYGTQARGLHQQEQETTIYYIDGIDESFIDHYKARLLSGRTFEVEFPNERNNVVINEQACRRLGFNNTEEALGEKILLEGDTVNIIGVIANYNHQSLKNNIDPQLFLYYGSYVPHFSVKLSSAASAGTIDMLATDYKEVFGQTMSDYYFLSEAFNEQYGSEIAFQKISGIFSFISVGLAALGLLGLVSYLLMKKIKEISLRRVFGASKASIMMELFKGIVVLILVSGATAIAISYYFVESWLADFAYKMQLSPLYFALPVLAILVVTIAIVIIYSLGTVSKNPIKWIKAET